MCFVSSVVLKSPHYAKPQNVITNGGGLSLRRQLYGRQKTFRPAFKDNFGIEVPDHLSDPSTIGSTVANALGVTALVDELVDLVPQAKSSKVFWPGYDEALPWGMAADLAYRRQLGIVDGAYVVAYTGNLHTANADEIRSLYLAVALLNRRGMQVRLVRTGYDYAPLTDHGEAQLREFTQDLGFVDRADLPRLLSIADVLVQPGIPDAFNVYRFP